MTIPLCQQCGKKIYARYGQRGYMGVGNQRYHYNYFKTQEERDAHEIPENATDIYTEIKYIAYYTPQQPRDGLFHNRNCWEEWHLNHREDIERMIRARGEWKY